MTDSAIAHRDFLYMGVAFELLDLRQDIEFHERFTDEGYPWETVVARLAELQHAVADYADEHFPVVEQGVTR